MNSSETRKVGNSHRRGLTLVELLVVIGIILMLIALFLPATRRARGPARRNNCSNQMRQLVLSGLNYESANDRFPLAMHGPAAPGITVHGPAPYAADDGYSYMVPLLAFAEQTALSDKIVAASNGLTEPIDSQVFQVSGTREYVWDQPIDLLICPSFPGENVAQGNYLPVRKPHVSNYHALVAGCVGGTEQRFADVDPETGGVIVTQQASPQGLNVADITDGTSKTILLTESRGEKWVAWFSGVSTSTVAISPDVATCGQLLARQVPAAPNAAAAFATFSDLPVGLNYGRSLNNSSRRDHPLFWSTRSDQREWGPSSAHDGNVVMTGYADGHVKALSPQIDSTTYFRLTTRGGGEPADDG